MAETRTRPARERQRVHTLIASELWFWRRMVSQEDPSIQAIEEWRDLQLSTRIRRFMGAVSGGDHIAVSEWESTPAATSQIIVGEDDEEEAISVAEAQQLAR